MMARSSPEEGRASAVESSRFDNLRLVPLEAAPPVEEVGANGSVDVKRELQDRMLAAISQDQIERLDERELRGELQRLVTELSHVEHGGLNFQDEKSLIDQVLDDLLGYGPVGALLRDNDISEILINGPHQVFVERQGQLHFANVTFRDEAQLLQVINRLLTKSGRQVNKKSPMVDARLPDGSRLNAVLNPPALNGPLVSIRRFGVRPLTVEDLLKHESIVSEMLDFLAACVKARMNIVISGGTGSGKTTLLNALSRYIQSSERLVTIEDTAELELQQPHVAKMESQPAGLDGEVAVTMRDLVRNALRMRPDRIIVGECRGGEALEMLQAMNTGHEGSMTTIHANNAREALARIELMVSLAGIEIPTTAIRKLISSSVTIIVQVARMPGGKRRIISISEVTGLEGDVISMHDVFGFVQTGMDANQSAEGYFHATGVRPKCLKTLNVRGAGLPPEFFSERRLQVTPRQRTNP
jgi:pilus assembly protein CpaF